MLEELRMLRISNTTVYPDIEGLSKELTTSFYSISEKEEAYQVGEANK